VITLEEAVERHSGVLFKYCYGILCDYYEAQDAVQETFARAFTKQASYREDTNYAGWLYRIAYNTCIGILRKKRFHLYEEIEKPYTTPDNSLSEEMLKALAALKPRDRALVFSRAIDDMDFAQLESVYNVSAATLRKRYERAKKKLQKHLNGGSQNG